MVEPLVPDAQLNGGTRVGIQVCLQLGSELVTTMMYGLPLGYTVLTFESDICWQSDTL